MPSRRELLLGFGAVGTVAVAGCLGSRDPEPGTSDNYAWPTTGADLRNSRAIPDGRAPRQEPTADWRVDIGSSQATAEPVVTDDVVLATAGTDIIAFGRETGDQLWSIDPDNDAYTYRGSPVVFDGQAYVPEVSTLTVRDLESGEIDWTYEFDNPIGSDCLTVSDSGDDGRVYVAGGNAAHALEAGSGEHLWTQELLGTARYAPAKYADSLFVATRGGELYNLKRWGDVEWRRTLEAGISSAPTVLTSRDRRTGHGVAVVAGDGTVTYFDLRGTREWETELGGFGDDGLAIAHRTLLARSGPTLHALDANDGGERWRVDLGSGAANQIVVGDTVYVGGDRLRAIDIDGGVGIRTLRVGEQRFEYDVPGAASYVTAADGTLFLTTNVFGSDPDQAELIALS